jgi:hypothetical protein
MVFRMGLPWFDPFSFMLLPRILVSHSHLASQQMLGALLRDGLFAAGSSPVLQNFNKPHQIAESGAESGAEPGFDIPMTDQQLCPPPY